MSAQGQVDPPLKEKELTRRIKELASVRGVPEVDLRGLISNVIVGQMLPDCVVKGGTAMYLRYGYQSARYSPDLDVSRRSPVTPEQFRDEFAELLSEGWGDFTGRLKVMKPAKKPLNVPEEYVMVPFEVGLLYRKRAWFSVPFELGQQELGGIDDAPMRLDPDIAALFAALGLPEPHPIPVLPSAHQVAQKLHACSKPGSARAHDLIDLQMLEAEGIDLADVAQVSRDLFRSRRTHPWPPTVAAGPDWSALYDAQRRDLPVKVTVDEAVVWVNAFIATVDGHLAAET